MKNTPAAKGFRMPAEWEKHEATWIGWPHNKTDWPGKITPIHWVYGEITRKLAQEEIARIIVNNEAHETQARRVLDKVGADSSRVEFFRFPTNRGWTRDFGPMFVKRQARRSEVAIANFRFNAWAKYKDFEKDNLVPELAAEALGLRIFNAEYKNTHVV